MMTEEPQNLLSLMYALNKGSIPITDSMFNKGFLFLQLLQQWNQVYSFTAVRDLEQMIARHWQDSLSIHAYLEGDNILDVGTGPGLPGVPLSIVNPDKKFCLLDSNEKRQIFLKQVVHQLNLQNVRLYCGRVEKFNANPKFSCIVSRAFKPLPVMLRLIQHLLSFDGSIVAMKGKIEEKELKEIDPKFKIDRIISLQNTSQAPQRHLIIIKFEQTT